MQTLKMTANMETDIDDEEIAEQVESEMDYEPTFQNSVNVSTWELQYHSATSRTQ